ncbi:MAG: hypothetical protein LBR54_04595 [Oscillospiraceae bacterium]|jgi:hypothetical protein|nr:hypothetical protein [Oscillospiraceae bacterium]
MKSAHFKRILSVITAVISMFAICGLCSSNGMPMMAQQEMELVKTPQSQAAFVIEPSIDGSVVEKIEFSHGSGKSLYSCFYFNDNSETILLGEQFANYVFHNESSFPIEIYKITVMSSHPFTSVKIHFKSTAVIPGTTDSVTEDTDQYVTESESLSVSQPTSESESVPMSKPVSESESVPVSKPSESESVPVSNPTSESESVPESKSASESESKETNENPNYSSRNGIWSALKNCIDIIDSLLAVLKSLASP